MQGGRGLVAGVVVLPASASRCQARASSLRAIALVAIFLPRRFTGGLRIEHRHADIVVDSYTDTAIWELMYLGKPGPGNSGLSRSGAGGQGSIRGHPLNRTVEPRTWNPWIRQSPE